MRELYLGEPGWFFLNVYPISDNNGKRYNRLNVAIRKEKEGSDVIEQISLTRKQVRSLYKYIGNFLETK